ncbi:MAG: hypothetical protein AB1568_00205 [Thermodesulfobacteriota bacterium]
MEALIMGMCGIVEQININRGMVAINTETGFTIIELIDDDNIDIGDKLCWDDDTALGHETYTNVSKGFTFEVVVQNHWVPKSQLNQHLLF